MKKSEMQERCSQLIRLHVERLNRRVKAHDESAAMREFGQICGMATMMREFDLIDYDQKMWIVEEAKKILCGKESSDETCG